MPMSEQDRVVWAATFARTNYGQSMPNVTEVRQYRTTARHGTNLASMVNLVCADFMETDDHYAMFTDEAYSWYGEFKDKELEYIFDTWKGKYEVWQASEVES